MNEKRRIRKKLIKLQNSYGKAKGRMAWDQWKKEQKVGQK